MRASRTADREQEGIIDWWCTEQEEAFSAQRPVYLSLEKEIRCVCGDDVYEDLAVCCRARQRARRPRRLTLLPIAPYHAPAMTPPVPP
ncbi:MAG: hypothetical protein ACRDPM_18545 [Solirubrobacteraceae bacterium]